MRLTRSLFFSVMAASLIGVVSIPRLSFAEDTKKTPKKDEKGPVTSSRIKLDEKSFNSADGVKLRGLFYHSSKGPNEPVVLMLHSFKANPDETNWEDTAKLLAEKGYNVLRFDFRGHGQSKEIEPEFWTDNILGMNPGCGQINTEYALPPGVKAKNKQRIDSRDFKAAYFPMLVQDIAAARNLIDLMNDNRELNSSTIYLLGVGNAATLGFLFISSEWSREAHRPAVPKPRSYVSKNIPLYEDAKEAGRDIAGAVWLTPKKPERLSKDLIKDWVLDPRSIKMRVETPMLFLAGEKDESGRESSHMFYSNILVANAKKAPNGDVIPELKQTNEKVIKNSANVGIKLLGNNLKTEEFILNFFEEVTKSRKNKERFDRNWEKPLPIDLRSWNAIPKDKEKE